MGLARQPDRRLNGSFSRLKEIAEKEEIATTVEQAFPAERLLNPDVFLSLLYYLGLLTIDRRERGQTVLRIPNLTVRSMFYEYLREGYKDVDIFRLDAGEYSRLISRMAYAGEWEPVLDYMAKAVREQTSIRDYIEGETALRAFLLAYLNITDLYITRSEVFQHAQSLNAVVLTADRDFANILRFPPGSHAGLVVSRIPDEVTTQTLNRLLLNALRALDPKDIAGALVIVEPSQVRIRR